MSVSREKVAEILDFFERTGRKCIVIWERTIAEASNPSIEISASINEGYGDFFRASATVLRKAAVDIDPEGEKTNDGQE